MSASIVRKGLGLFSDDIVLPTEKHTKTKKGKDRMKKTKHLTGNLSSLKRKSAVAEKDKYTPTDNIQHNLRIIKRLAQKQPTQVQMVKKILNHYQGMSTVKKVEVKKSIFTDEDFEKFDREFHK